MKRKSDPKTAQKIMGQKNRVKNLTRNCTKKSDKTLNKQSDKQSDKNSDMKSTKNRRKYWPKNWTGIGTRNQTKMGQKNWPNISVKKLVQKIEQNIREQMRQKNGEEKSDKNELRRIKLTFIFYKVSQDKLNKNSQIGKVSKISLYTPLSANVSSVGLKAQFSYEEYVRIRSIVHA